LEKKKVLEKTVTGVPDHIFWAPENQGGLGPGAGNNKRKYRYFWGRVKKKGRIYYIARSDADDPLGIPGNNLAAQLARNPVTRKGADPFFYSIWFYGRLLVVFWQNAGWEAGRP